MTDPNVPASLDVRPRTVVYVGNFRHPWCTEVHVALALSSLGCTVVRCQEDQVDWPGLARYVDDGAAELVIWQRSQKIDFAAALGALEDLRRLKVPVVSYHLDRWVGLDREHELSEHPFFRTDLVVSPDGTPHGRWEQLDIRHYWMPPGVAAEETVIGQRSKQWADLDAVFVGSYPYPHPEWAPVRHDLIEAFRSAFGKRFAVLPGRQAPIRNKALADLYATVPVVLGDSCLVGNPHLYWSDRVPETLGRGGTLIHPYADGIEDWYRDRIDLRLYPPGECDWAVDMAREYLADRDKAAAIGAHGQITVLARDTYAHRMAELLHLIDAGGVPTRPATPKRRYVTGSFRSSDGATAQGRFLVDDRDGVAGAVDEVWKANDYRLERRHVKGGVVIDIGANTGAFSVLAAKLGAARVEAYEPDPGNFDLLLENTRQAEGVVTCWPVAVSASTGYVRLGHEGGGAHTRPISETEIKTHRKKLIAERAVIVQADRLEDIIGRHLPADVFDPPFSTEARLRPDQAAELAEAAGEPEPVPEPVERVLVSAGEIALLKMDIEGGEYAAFSSLPRWMLRRVKRIVLEFHGPAMPHLRHLNGDLDFERIRWPDEHDVLPHAARWGRLVRFLATEGHFSVVGRPDVGGLLWWDRYDAPEIEWDRTPPEATA